MKTSYVATQVVTWLLVVSMSGPSLASAANVDSVLNSNVSAGDTAAAVPTVDSICKAFDNAKAGDFTGSDGKPLMTVDGDCAAKYPYRTDQVKYCAKPVKDIIAQSKGAQTLDSLCSGSNGRLAPGVQTYCSLRSIANTSQAAEYCEAYRSADKAGKGISVLTTLDVAAAGICWAEYLSVKALIAAKKADGSIVGSLGSGSILNSGACGGATVAAGLGELVHTSRILVTGQHTGGESKIDSSDNVVDKKSFNFDKVVEMVLSAGLSLKAIQLGVCYYSAAKYPGLCKSLDKSSKLSETSKISKTLNPQRSAARFAAQNQKQHRKSMRDFKRGKITDGELERRDAELEKQEFAEASDGDIQNAYDALEARAKLAHQSALIFSGLAAMRVVSKFSVAATKKKTKDILQSMFDPSNTNATMGTAGLNTTSLPNLFMATTSTYNVGTAPSEPQSNAVTAGSPEAFLASPHAPLGIQAGKIAAQMPSSLVDHADSGAGLGAAVAGAAMAAGAKEGSGLNEIRATTASIFANLPKDSGGYSSGGGGRSLASQKDSGGPDLNLKSLFNADGEKQEAQGGMDLAFRGPAQDEDIWHSQNPKGNNLFQIVSDKYDIVQRKSAVGPGL